MVNSTKIIGTLVPMFSLVSHKAQTGTFEAGEQLLGWLSKTNQSAWQMLPLNQTQLEPGSDSKHVSSPYKGYGIGLDPRFLSKGEVKLSASEYDEFIHEHSYWVHDYSLFCALRDHFGTDNWRAWSQDIAKREEIALEYWREELKESIARHLLTQAKLHSAYNRLRSLARKKNILMIGDMPFYVGINSPLAWKYSHLFEIESDNSLKVVSGVLQGKKSHYGRQVWGHPLYKWQDSNLHQELVDLFKLRICHLASLFDWARFDHAKGLFVYGSMSSTTELEDRYLKGPGKVVLDELINYARSNRLNLYAEDTGDRLVTLRECLRENKIPGVKIFRFAYNEKRQVFSSQYLEFVKYPSNTFAYTTTHDTEPLMSYLDKLSLAERAQLCNKLDLEREMELSEMVKSIRNKLIKSPAKFVIIPLQDWVLSRERINTPGTETEFDDPNWRYKMERAIEELPSL